MCGVIGLGDCGGVEELWLKYGCLKMIKVMLVKMWFLWLV